MQMRDFQKSKVYRWERKHVAPFDKGAVISFDAVKMMVAGIWMAEGLINPPIIVPKDVRNTTAWAKADRSKMWVPEEGLPRWVVLHELAHCLNSQAVNLDGNADLGDRHGANFVGIYMKLLVKYLNAAMPLLMFTAQKDGVAFNIGAQVAFKD